MSHLSVESLPEPGDRYVLGEVLGVGVWAKVVHYKMDKMRVYFITFFFL